MWGFLLLLAAAAAIGLMVWNFRRKTREREALSKARFEEMFKNEYRGGQTDVSAAPAVAAPRPAAAVAAGPPPAPGPLLTQSETLVYYLLRTAMPDQVVFAKVPLSSVIGAGGRENATQPPLLDFVVCDRSMRVSAVVELTAADSVKARRLGAAGVRLAFIDVAALPPRNEIRARVLGETPPGA